MECRREKSTSFMDCLRLKDAGRDAIGNAKSSSLNERLSVDQSPTSNVIYLFNNLFTEYFFLLL
jgi:hypothetical protein